MGVSRLTGMNSDAISIATHSDMDQTAVQAPFDVSARRPKVVSVKVYSVCLSFFLSARSARVYAEFWHAVMRRMEQSRVRDPLINE